MYSTDVMKIVSSALLSMNIIEMKIEQDEDLGCIRVVIDAIPRDD